MVGQDKVRDGYKLTEVGVIPEDWEVDYIGNLFAFKNGLNKGKEFFGMGTPIINYMDVYGGREILAENVKGTVEVTKNEIMNFCVKKGDVFFTRTSETPEEVGISSVLVDDIVDAVFSGFILRARPTDCRLTNGYKKYCFITNRTRKDIISSCTYTTRALTNGRSLSKVLLPIPPLPEQTAIATALSDTDKLMESLERLIDKKRRIKQGAMQDLLTGRKRLPGFSGEWEVKKLGDVADIQKGQMITEKDSIAGPIPVIAGGKKPSYYNMYANRNGKTITISASGANAGYVALYKQPIFASDCSTISENNKYCIEFIFYQLLLMQKKIYYLQTGGAQPHVQPSNLISVPINATSIEEQKAIAQLLSDMDSEIEALEQKLAKYRSIKQGMMQELLTGRIRLI